MWVALRRWVLVCGLFLLVAGAGCVGRRPPVLEQLVERTARTPVIVVPGITGTVLRHRDSGRVLWGDARGMFLPRDGGYALAHPIPSTTPDPIDADQPIGQIRLFGLLRFDIYESTVRLLERNGYRHGDLDHPRPDDTLFLFPYDWRYENHRAVRELAEALERLRVARGEAVLHVDLIGQSNAGRIARYLLKYGAATIEEAEAGHAGPPERIRVDKLILVGAAHGGALGTLDEFNRGRRYVPLVGRRIRPEVAFTFRSVYEELPAYRQDLFVDRAGNSIDVDLYDPRSWERYGWSIHDPRIRRRIDRAGRDDLFGDAAQRAEFLAESLDRARRMHALLARDAPGFGATRYYVLENGYVPTADRAMLVPRGEGWDTFGSEDRRVARDPYLKALARAPGDGHGTLDSQRWLSPQERRALARPPVAIPAPHRKIIRHPAAQRLMLEYLLE